MEPTPRFSEIASRFQSGAVRGRILATLEASSVTDTDELMDSIRGMNRTEATALLKEELSLSKMDASALAGVLLTSTAPSQATAAPPTSSSALTTISDALADISTELGKQSKKLKFVVKEVVIQHRMRMDNWTESKRSKEEQEAFKEVLITFYQRHHISDSTLLRCMVLDDFFPRNLVIASHIWKHCTRGEGLDEFGLLEEDLSNPRNGILMCREIECAFDTKRLCFLVDRIYSTNLVLKVLDPLLVNPVSSPLVIPGHSSLKFCDIDGRNLQHPVDNLPFRRILNFHAKRSYQKAINRGWLAANSTFDDFFEMSINASIPDLNVYQTLFEDEED